MLYSTDPAITELPLQVEADTNATSSRNLKIFTFSRDTMFLSINFIEKTAEIQIQNSLDVIWNLFDLLHWLWKKS